MSEAERVAAGWVVGRGDPAIYVEQTDRLVIGGPDCGEAIFETEAEALEYAIMCELDYIEPIKRNLLSLRARLRRVSRQSVATILKGQSDG